MAGNGYKGLENGTYLSKMLKTAPRVEYTSLESQFRDLVTQIGLSVPAK